MELDSNELEIDYDSIEAPQFVDFQSLSIADDTEDPAPRFFEQRNEDETIERNIDTGFGDSIDIIITAPSDPTGHDQEMEAQANNQILENAVSAEVAQMNDIRIYNTPPSNPVDNADAEADSNAVIPFLTFENGLEMAADFQGDEPQLDILPSNAVENAEADSNAVIPFLTFENGLEMAAADFQGEEPQVDILPSNPVEHADANVVIPTIENGRDMASALQPQVDILPFEAENANLNVVIGTIENGVELAADIPGHEPQLDILPYEAENVNVNLGIPAITIENGLQGATATNPVSRIPAPCKTLTTGTGMGKVTIPKPFHFQNMRYTKPSHVTEEKKDHGFAFKARPAPMKVLHGAPTGLKDKQEVKATVPVAPHFASDDRIRSRQMRASQLHTMTKENLEPLMHGRGDAGPSRRGFRSVPSTPNRGNSAGRGRSPSPSVRADKPVTVTKPFSFEERERERKRLREEKMRQLDEANRLFQEGKQDVRKPVTNPVKATRVFEVKQSNKPLTNPMSPAFAKLPSQRRNLHQLHNNAQSQ